MRFFVQTQLAEYLTDLKTYKAMCDRILKISLPPYSISGRELHESWPKKIRQRLQTYFASQDTDRIACGTCLYTGVL